MNTLEKLNAHLATEVTQHSSYSIKARAEHIRCSDGVTLSVQASNFHYSTPDGNVGPYTAVEVWRINGDDKVTEFEYSEDYPSAYVPIELVVEFINRHCGFADTI